LAARETTAQTRIERRDIHWHQRRRIHPLQRSQRSGQRAIELAFAKSRFHSSQCVIRHMFAFPRSENIAKI